MPCPRRHPAHSTPPGQFKGRPPRHRRLRLHQRPLPLLLPHVQHTFRRRRLQSPQHRDRPAHPGLRDWPSGTARARREPGTRGPVHPARPVGTPQARGGRRLRLCHDGGLGAHHAADPEMSILQVAQNYAVTSPVSRLGPEVGEPLKGKSGARAQRLLPDGWANTQFVPPALLQELEEGRARPMSLSPARISLSYRR